MPCYSPLHAYEGKLTEAGKVATVWKRSDSPEQVGRVLPCSKCIDCKLVYSRDWAIRCVHEAQMHKVNCFVTLTFNDKYLPVDGSLDVLDFQLFMKRLRKKFSVPIRYFHAGEYGGKLGRPHYHALLFGLDFPDKILKTVRLGNRVYESKALSEVWPFGFHSIGDVSFASASYVARYCVKKVNGSSSDEHYVIKSSGVLRKPEYTTMSRRPGIGASWFRKFKSDVFPSDQVVFDGKVFKPPRFYDNLLDRDDPELLESIKNRRRMECKYNSDRRLLDMEQVKLAQVSLLKRPLEV